MAFHAKTIKHLQELLNRGNKMEPETKKPMTLNQILQLLEDLAREYVVWKSADFCKLVYDIGRPGPYKVVVDLSMLIVDETKTIDTVYPIHTMAGLMLQSVIEDVHDEDDFLHHYGMVIQDVRKLIYDIEHPPLGLQDGCEYGHGEPATF